MAIDYVGSGAWAWGNNANVTPSLPSGLQAGDTMLCCTFIRENTAASLQAPTGWTEWFAYKGAVAETSQRVYVRTYVSGDSAPLCTAIGGGSNDTTGAVVIALRGVQNIYGMKVAESSSAQWFDFDFLQTDTYRVQDHDVVLGFTAITNDLDYPAASVVSNTSDVQFTPTWKYDVKDFSTLGSDATLTVSVCNIGDGPSDVRLRMYLYPGLEPSTGLSMLFRPASSGTNHTGAANSSIAVTSYADGDKYLPNTQHDAAADSHIAVTTIGSAGDIKYGAAVSSIAITTTGIALLAPSEDSALGMLQSGWNPTVMPPMYIGPTRRDFYLPYPNLQVRRRAAAAAIIEITSTATGKIYHTTPSAEIVSSASLSAGMTTEKRLKATAVSCASSVYASLRKFSASISGNPSVTAALTGGAAANLLKATGIGAIATLGAPLYVFDKNLDASLKGVSACVARLATGDKLVVAMPANASIFANLSVFQAISSNISAVSNITSYLTRTQHPLVSLLIMRPTLGAALSASIKLKASGLGGVSIHASLDAKRYLGAAHSVSLATVVAQLSTGIVLSSALNGEAVFQGALSLLPTTQVPAHLYGQARMRGALGSSEIRLSAALKATAKIIAYRYRDPSEIVNAVALASGGETIYTTTKEGAIWVSQ